MDWECAVAAAAVKRFSCAAFADLRKTLGPADGKPLPASFLKQVDDQTLVGLAAVYAALGQAGLASHEVERYGVVAAPRFLGRNLLANALAKFKAEGAWGISPHLPANACLHSLSGAISVALKIHGPNLGVGGGPNALADAFLTSIALCDLHALPGVLLVITSFEPEPIPDAAGQHSQDCTCAALCLMLRSAVPGWNGWSLRLRHELHETASPGSEAKDPPLSELLAGLEALTTNPQHADFHWSLPGVGTLVWQQRGQPGSLSQAA
jgi:hypothetical protein